MPVYYRRKTTQQHRTYLFRWEMTYLKTSWFSFGNFFSTSLRACNFCSRSLISERENQRLSGLCLVGVLEG